MSKKRNLAVLMAAATVATSVAPVFAAEVTESLDGKTISAKDSEKLAKLKTEIEGLLGVRYTSDKELLSDEDLAGVSVYTITAKLDNGTDTPIKSIRDLEKLLVKMEKDNQEIVVKAEENAAGHKEFDGKVLDNEVKTYKAKDITALKTALTASGVTLPDGVVSVDSDANNIYIELQKNDKVLTLKAGDSITLTTDAGVLAASETIYKQDAFDNYLDKDGKITTDTDEYVALGFKTVKSPLEDFEEEKVYTINNVASVDSVKASELYNLDLDKLTAEGNSVLQFINEYNTTAPTGSLTSTQITEANGVLKVKVPVNKEGLTNKFSELSISGTKNEIAGLKAILEGGAPTIKTLAGDNREKTAIEISKATFTQANASGNNVVLVSGYSIADGLTATPFAKANQAPVLLTGKDSISEDVMDEIKRVIGDKGTVYLVGGTASLSAEVENQLNSKFIANDRIAGTNRMDTSLKIAQQIAKDNDTKFDKLFVAGGHAEADAMSIAAVAAAGKDNATANTVDPILLTDANGLNSAQKTWLDRQDTIKKAYIAGGLNSVPASVGSDLRPMSEEVVRLSGNDRQGTNAKVLTEFYKTNTINKLYVAKSDNNGLVDALPAGVLAGQNGDPVVLATDALSADQEAAFKQFTTKVGSVADKTQIGNGIADAVWTAINKIK